ncbi:unnamed protein product [Tilletia laevis]|nr:unnamed protein product [Tilletia caries]CAD6898274.1 unnamed protein product [Tilletia laevis]CAD6907084.1 unnamed protein product [Tilletia controversa]CAD6930368.1 unnamed protein product [Tilletia caries]CAD6956907.1 unnamed protein product [Tilletia laevis]
MAMLDDEAPPKGKKRLGDQDDELTAKDLNLDPNFFELPPSLSAVADDKATVRARLEAAALALDADLDSPDALALAMALEPPGGYGVGEDRGRPVKHLGTWLYDSRIDPLLPGELLSANVGATLEVRIPGAQLGRGPSADLFRALGLENALPGIELAPSERKHLGSNTITPTRGKGGRAGARGVVSDDGVASATPGPAGTIGVNENRGRWTLGWRGREHAKLRAQLAAESGSAVEEMRRFKRRRPLVSVPAEDATTSEATQATSPEAAKLGGRKDRFSDQDAIDAAWSFWSAPALRERRCWGTDVYTDDSDVLAMCIHAGWIEPPALELEHERERETISYEEGRVRVRKGPGLPGWVPSGKAMWAWKSMSAKELASRIPPRSEGRRPGLGGQQPNGAVTPEEGGERDAATVDVPLTSVADEIKRRTAAITSGTTATSPANLLRPADPRPPDLSVMLRIAPRLIAYRGCLRAGFKSRSWGNTHDGVSLVVESVELKEPGYATARGRRAAKVRLHEMTTLRRAVLACGEGTHEFCLLADMFPPGKRKRT